MRKLTIRAAVITRKIKRSPIVRKFAKDLVFSTATSTATDVILHHKIPPATVVFDVAMSNSIAVCIKFVEHHI